MCCYFITGWQDHDWTEIVGNGMTEQRQVRI